MGGSFNVPTGVAVDSNGNVFVAATDSSTVNEIPAGCTCSNCVANLGAGFSGPFGVAVDGNNNVYVADSLNSAVKEIALGSVNFQTVAVGATSAVQTLTFTVDTAGTVGTPLVLTQDAPNLDYTDAGTGTCTTNGPAYIYSVGNTSTVNVVFSPKLAGTRNGAVVLVNASGAPIATVYLYGTGTGPQIAFSSNVLKPVYNDSSLQVAAIATDAAGNVYIADKGGNRLLKVPAGGGSAITLVSGIHASGVAIDGAGNLFANDSRAHQLVMFTYSLSQQTYTSSVVAGEPRRRSGS